MLAPRTSGLLPFPLPWLTQLCARARRLKLPGLHAAQRFLHASRSSWEALATPPASHARRPPSPGWHRLGARTRKPEGGVAGLGSTPSGSDVDSLAASTCGPGLWLRRTRGQKGVPSDTVLAHARGRTRRRRVYGCIMREHESPRRAHVHALTGWL